MRKETPMSGDKTPDPMPMQGEGAYDAARRFRKAETKFAEKGPVAKKAREAADALNGPESDDIEAARRSTAQGHPQHRR
jgi:hypothetical protein